jgi:hypothetical protein
MPTISCTEFSRQLDEAIERRESVDTVRLREHAGTCAECRGLWLDALVVDRAVAQWKKPVAVAGLTDRILAHVAAETAGVTAEAPLNVEVVPANSRDQAPGRPPRRIPRTGVAIAALALCVCAMLLINRPRPQLNVTQPEVVQSSQQPAGGNAQAIQNVPALATAGPTSPPSASTPTTVAPVELMVADAGSAYLHLAGDAAKAVTAASVLVPSADSADEAPSAPKDEQPWVDGMRREIAPVTHQLSHAFEFLIQAVPEKRAPAT